MKYKNPKMNEDESPNMEKGERLMKTEREYRPKGKVPNANFKVPKSAKMNYKGKNCKY